VIVLVTRPEPDGEMTARSLRDRGHDVLLSPMLRFEPVAFQIEADARYGAVVVTSANALRAVADHPALDRLVALPLLGVGARTAEVARGMGFRTVMSADGDAAALRDRVLACIRDKSFKTLTRSSAILYLAGADIAHDLATELGGRGLNVATVTSYRMVPQIHLPAAVCDGFAAQRIDAVLHYSRRSARAFLDAARAGGVEISALAIPQCCLSDSIAAILRDAGATQVTVSRTPDENALFEVLERAVQASR
jgi:uroporphyrinogen-III synthase